MQYWINIDGIQSGPISREELSKLSFNPDDTYIWHKGLDDWLPIAEVPELCDIADAAAAAFAAKQTVQQAPTPIPDKPEAIAEQPAEGIANVQEPVQEVPLATDSAEVETRTTDDPHIGTPPPLYHQAPFQYATAPAIPQPDKQPDKRPNTYIIWSIVVTLLCCQVTGIIAIVYGALSSAQFSSGDYAKAQSYSENAALWIQISIAVGLVIMPLGICLSLLV